MLCISVAYVVVRHGWLSRSFVYCGKTAKDTGTATCYEKRIGNRT